MAGPRTHVEMGAWVWEKHLSVAPSVPSGLTALMRSPLEYSAFYCGCMFPDWGYDGIHDDAWSWLVYPYYRRKYPWCHAHYQGTEYGAIAHGAAVAAHHVRETYAQLEL